VLAIEYGPWNIRVNTLSPGAIMTPNLQRALDRFDHYDKLIAKSALKRVGQPEEIASVATFLASDESSFVTATNIIADGGYLTL
jgi:meso-butanediol dehydrogenase / (S,S)-butanediol dehydrogenase / diacetyl reductase